jgi:hypothetical protein
MRPRTLVIVGVLVVILLALTAHLLDLPNLLGTLNPHALR